MAGLIPTFTSRDLERWIDRFTDRAEEKMIRVLVYAGDQFVTLARNNGNYKDHTGNLRSSIGYLVIQDGNVISEGFQKAGQGTEGNKGVADAKRLAQELALTHNKGLVLIGLAGMDYALHVENIAGRDVISSSEQIAKQMVKQLLKKTLND